MSLVGAGPFSSGFRDGAGGGEDASAPISVAGPSGLASAGCGVASRFSKGLQPVDAGKDQRVEHDRQDRAGKDQVAPLLGKQVQADAELGEDEGELADLREARRDHQRRADRMAERDDDQECRNRLADDDDEEGREDRPGVVEQAGRVEQHADRDEEQHREGVAQRQRFLGRAVAELGFAHDHAGEEGAERQRHAEEMRSSEGDAERDRKHREAEQLARAGMRDVVQDPRDDPPADDQHQRDEGGHLGEGHADHAPDAEIGGQREQSAGTGA